MVGVKLLVGVMSTLDNIEQQTNILNTWGKFHPVVFLISSPYLDPCLRKKTLCLRGEENYNNNGISSSLYLKTCAFLDYGVRSQAKYIFKTDDDSYVKYNVLLEHLLKNNPSYWGNSMWSHAKTPRSGKNQISKKSWSSDRLPRYASGAGYAISHKLAKCVALQAATNSLISSEDVGVGRLVSLCGEKLTHSNLVDAMGTYSGESNWIVKHYVKNMRSVIKHP